MINNKKIIVVLPAYNASKTLTNTYNEIPFSIVDDVILVDDNSPDKTIKVANELDVYFYSGLILFLTILFYFGYTTFITNFNYTFYESGADISYFILCLPFALFHIFYDNNQKI